MNILKRIVIISMSASFIVLAVTGIIKFPEIQRYFLFVYNALSASQLTMIHDWSGIIFIALLTIHLVLKWEGLKNAFTGSSHPSGRLRMQIAILVGILLVGMTLFFVYTHFLGTKKPINLSAVEVKEYQGEKLGSLYDFRENSIKGTQYVDKSTYRLEITGLVDTPAKLSYEDILASPLFQKIVTIHCVEGWSVKVLWEGVLVSDVLKNVAIHPEAMTIIFYAADGYSTSFPLEYILKNNIMIASKMNGVVLPPERGFPFQLIAEQKWGYKWIKWITKIELSDDSTYKGFWESRGYNNNGDLSGSKFDH